MDALKTVFVPIHPAGWPFIIAFAVGSLILGKLWPPLGWAGVILSLWCVYFFRDPPRVTPVREGLVISPADGHVQKIATVVPPPELQLGDQPRTRISVFLNVFDVHVNRIPVDGKIVALHYHPGKFLNAALDKASDENERQLVTVESADGKRFGVIQIAGLVARRIICTLAEGQEVKAGERFGLIRFGSRVDVFLPEGVSPLVIEGQYVLGGETVMADLNASEPARAGEVR